MDLNCGMDWTVCVFLGSEEVGTRQVDVRPVLGGIGPGRRNAGEAETRPRWAKSRLGKVG